MKWIRPAIVKLNNLRAIPSLYRGYADTRVFALFLLLFRFLPGIFQIHLLPQCFLVI